MVDKKMWIDIDNGQVVADLFCCLRDINTEKYRRLWEKLFKEYSRNVNKKSITSNQVVRVFLSYMYLHRGL